MKVSNQKPVVLSPVYDAVIKGDFEPQKYMKQTMATPLFTPLVAGTPVTMTANGSQLTDDDITDMILACMGDTIDPTAETAAKTMFQQTLTYFDAKSTLTIQDTFAIQAAVKEKLPAPTPSIVYTPATDVIPSCKEFLSGTGSFEKMFTAFAFYTHPQTLGVYFANEQCFDSFKTWLAGEIAQISAALPAHVNQLFADFQKLDLNQLTESLIIRNDDSEGNDEFSFPRTLVAYIMLYTKQVSPAMYGIMPFNVGELFCPKTVIFINVERHSRATAKQVADEWKIIQNSMKIKPKIANTKKLQKLTGIARSISHAQHNAQYANSGNGIEKAKSARFRKTAPTMVDMTKLIKSVINNMANVAKSENTFKSSKMTFARPNRRDPDDFNKQGKMISTKYKPDIHLYIDTSGSISERNYQDAVKACIAMAKKLNVNLYFNSFSHCISQCTHLHTKDKSKSKIYKEFQKVPKVTGGTDFEQVWNYINRSPKRRRELSIMMTDFGYSAPNHYVRHPKNLVYIPCSHMNWDSIVDDAKYFLNSMQHIDPACRKKILF